MRGEGNSGRSQRAEDRSARATPCSCCTPYGSPSASAWSSHVRWRMEVLKSPQATGTAHMVRSSELVQLLARRTLDLVPWVQEARV